VRKDKPRNMAASVRQRLMDMAHNHGDDFQLVLTRYVIERFLYRLSCSVHREEFVLKGAMLFRLWNDQPHRPTRDLDLLAKGDHSIEHLVGVFKTITGLTVEDDGLMFNPDMVRGELIKEAQDYEGVRVRCEVRLGNARIVLQIDIGFGDAITPNTEKIKYPTILNFQAPELQAYPRQTVVAEKYQAMVMLGIANSRMKDFYDLWILARTFAFDGPTLCRAIQATFHRRKTCLPTEPPLALTASFGTDAAKVKQWQAFIRKGKLDVGDTPLEKVCGFLNGFLVPLTQALVAKVPFENTWPPAGPWTA
jgi:predicted nucleotidyltransferase component of viral defense system